MRRVWRRNGVRRPGKSSRLLSWCIVIWATPPGIRRLSVLVAHCWLLLLLWRWVWRACSRKVVRRRRLLLGGIRCLRRVTITRHCRLLGMLVIRCLGTRRMGPIPGICLLLRRGHLSLMRLPNCWVGISSRRILILKTETCHLPLYIFHHFSALNVSSHHKITALLLYICNRILFIREKKAKASYRQRCDYSFPSCTCGTVIERYKFIPEE